MAAELPDPPDVSPDLPAGEDEDLVALFRERAQMVDAVVHGPVSHHGVPKAVAGIVSGHDARSFMAWDDLGVPGVVSAMTAAGLDRIDHHVPAGDRIRHQLSYETLDVGVTGAEAGLAVSGSVILAHGPGRPRMASLVPGIHIALLDAGSIEPTLALWVQRHPRLVETTSNLVVVTGPSRTGDIEQELNLGVHGPRHVHIVMIK